MTHSECEDHGTAIFSSSLKSREKYWAGPGFLFCLITKKGLYHLWKKSHQAEHVVCEMNLLQCNLERKPASNRKSGVRNVVAAGWNGSVALNGMRKTATNQ